MAAAITSAPCFSESCHDGLDAGGGGEGNMREGTQVCQRSVQLRQVLRLPQRHRRDGGQP